MQRVVATLARRFSAHFRARRAALFRSLFVIDRNTRILDLGSETGAHIAAVLQGTGAQPRNVFIADIDAQAVAQGSRDYGFTPVVIDESGILPFPDRFFDIVYCSSVIEHVTVPKQRIWTLRSARAFEDEARRRQKAFAGEIRRVGRRCFVQTPYRHFPIESHTWLPLAGWLPRRLLIPLLRVTNRFWVKKASPDFHLLDRGEMARLFDGATIVEERAFGMVKSIIAVCN